MIGFDVKKMCGQVVYLICTEDQILFIYIYCLHLP